MTNFKNLLLKNHWVNFNQTWQKHPWVMGIHVSSNEGSRPFPRGDNNKIANIHFRTLKIVFSRITGPISTKRSTKHSRVMGIQVCSNEGPSPFPRGDNKEKAKLH